MILPKFILLFDGVIFGLVGLIFCFDVHRFAKTINIFLTQNTGTIDFRATYGGLDLGLGVFFLVAALSPKYQEAGLVCAILVLFGLLLTRLAGIIMEGPDPFMIKLLLIEMVMVAMNLAAYFKSKAV